MSFSSSLPALASVAIAALTAACGDAVPPAQMADARPVPVYNTAAVVSSMGRSVEEVEPSPMVARCSPRPTEPPRIARSTGRGRPRTSSRT